MRCAFIASVSGVFLAACTDPDPARPSSPAKSSDGGEPNTGVLVAVGGLYAAALGAGTTQHILNARVARSRGVVRPTSGVARDLSITVTPRGAALSGRF